MSESLAAAPPLPEAVRHELQQRIERHELDLPLLGPTASRVLSVCSEDACDLRELADLLHQDASLAGHVLRLANSPLSMPTVPIVSLPQAISRLGTSRIRQIAVLASCESRVFQVPGFEDTVQIWFLHSLAAALCAESIARAKRWNVEEAFLAGLLHDVGRPVVLQAVLDLAEETGTPVERAAALAASEEYHAVVAGTLIDSWHIPGAIGQIVRWHEAPEVAPAACHTQVALVALADELAHDALGPRPVEARSLRGHPSLTVLNLYPDDLQQLIDQGPSLNAKVEALR